MDQQPDHAAGDDRGDDPPVEVRMVADRAEADAALDLAERVSGTRPLSDPVLRALELAGPYLSIAVGPDGDGTAPIGMCAGFVGIQDTPSHLHLHSHLAAVDPGWRRRGVGLALKRHQRTWCIERDIDEITWTFDPLVVANARFNLHQLGAAGDRYLVDLYGPMEDEINRGDPSDRLLVRWSLWSPDAAAALTGSRSVPEAEGLRAEGAADLVRFDDDGGPVGVDPPDPDDGRVWLVALPDDIVALRRTDADRARRWRSAVRDALVAAFDSGRQPTAVADDGSYVLPAPSREIA